MQRLINELIRIGYNQEDINKLLIEETPSHITEAEHVYNLLKEYTHYPQEYFICLTLDGASKLINKHEVFKGTLNQSLVHPREIYTLAIQDRAAGIIVAHNHPSGTLEPSRADVQITHRLKAVGKLVGIELLDHIIVSNQGYYSFSDDALL
jgi:DNA repair protein RadC